ncbi:MAG: threonine--tRNA ligase [Thermoanaerobaculaceae bacterium]|nr:threonine--tRNA ligase [Thermoanaerobaculaceae bacterium]MDI9620865.1 threonine--tRNA ligase [Acidobacteriota bacterium]NLH10136.1 threonine--tRNA ligase [Holophagae bacterium]HPW54733.1 threonine--tRNA ligase [Thermoanaerobaculaceae bacterium]
MSEQSIELRLPDGSSTLVPAGTTPLAVAQQLGSRLAAAAVAGELDGQVVDLRAPLGRPGAFRVLTSRDPEAAEVIRHSAEHVLADAVERLFPGTIIDAGRQDHSEKFQYDFRFPRGFTPEDLERIEAEMARIVAAAQPFTREEVSLAEAEAIFRARGEELKLVRLRDIPEGEPITLFRHGEFVDLCRGPHVQRTDQIGAFKLIETSGAYFKGDERNEMLQRIYGTAFASREELDAYFAKLEDARRRDHRRLGRELDLYSFSPLAPASPFFHPRGAIVYNQLVAFMRHLYKEFGHQEVVTPQLFDVELWKRSGHYDAYRENMFFSEVDGREYSLKPMNCPSHCVIYATRGHSYRDLPVRMADFGRLHRYERSGVVQGLTRVRSFSQDDAHIFCTPQQIGQEVSALFRLMFRVYDTFGFKQPTIYFSTRPEKAIGEPALWAHAERTLEACLAAQSVPYVHNPGEGAFYGPKVDFVVADAIGREWQLGTIQLDFVLPVRFALSYVAEDGSEQRPVMIHRAVMGSIERFFGVMLEHFAGDLPLWLAPEQARVLPVSDRFLEAARTVAARLQDAGLRAEVDERSEKLGAKIRDGELQKIPVLLIVGEREATSGAASVRLRHRGDLGARSLDDIIHVLGTAARERSLAVWSEGA